MLENWAAEEKLKKVPDQEDNYMKHKTSRTKEFGVEKMKHKGI